MTTASDAASSRRLPIAETFPSLQGEGRLTGVPSFFIRVSGCNLRCAWCDTPYASWKPEGDSRDVADIVEEAERSGVRHVVVTGGEPMIFDAIEPLCASLAARGLHVTIETAGTVFRDVACDLMSISPKLANSTPDEGTGWRERHEARRLNVDVLQRLIDRYVGRQLKFVVVDEGDVDEIDALLAQLTGWVNDDIMLMPEGVEPPDAERTRAITSLCVKRNWRYCRRLHIDLFGNTRGT